METEPLKVGCEGHTEIHRCDAIEDFANLVEEEYEGEADAVSETGDVFGDGANLGEDGVTVLGKGVVVLGDEDVADLGDGDDLADEGDVTVATVLAVEFDTKLEGLSTYLKWGVEGS